MMRHFSALKDFHLQQNHSFVLERGKVITWPPADPT